MSTYLRIVELLHEKYAVQKGKGRWKTQWEFCEADTYGGSTKYGRTWYSGSPDTVLKYCIVDTMEKAEETLERTLEVLRMPSEKEQIQVVKVVKKVRV